MMIRYLDISEIFLSPGHSKTHLTVESQY